MGSAAIGLSSFDGIIDEAQSAAVSVGYLA
jgi:hypothetical protein